MIVTQTRTGNVWHCTVLACGRCGDRGLWLNGGTSFTQRLATAAINARLRSNAGSFWRYSSDRLHVDNISNNQNLSK